jgi:hypothetical protein
VGFGVRGSAMEGCWWRRSMPLGMRALPQRKVGVSDGWDLGEVVEAASHGFWSPASPAQDLGFWVGFG